MNTWQHPDWTLEEAHLAETMDIIDREITVLEAETGWSRDKSKVVVVRSVTIDQEIAVHNVLLMKASTLYQLTLSHKQPYFTRVDFAEKGASETKTYYIGRWGITQSPHYETVVADWRSPIANLYYSGELGQVSYTAPDGTVEGTLTLKRMLSVQDGKLEAISDAGLYERDSYLLSVLGEASTGRLRDIVTTIQREQNDVIRHPMEKALFVQGVAGSGKTTIALHRIAWLLYAYQNTLAPSQMMILAPNPMFLRYIADVLPDLGVEQVRQTTFALFCAQLMGKRAPRLRRDDKLEARLSMDARDAERMEENMRVKGSLSFREDILAYLNTLENTLRPSGDVTFGRRVLMSADEQTQIFRTQLKLFPMQQRVLELEKHARTRAKSAAARMRAQLEDAMRKRLDELEAVRLPERVRGEHARRLLDSYDRRTAEIADEEARVAREYAALWPDLNTVRLYLDFLKSKEEYAPMYEELSGGREAVYPEDLPALVVICRAVHGLKRVITRHIVIDEAQDFTPFHYALLREVAGHASFTVVGDLMQGVRGAGGLENWDAARAFLPDADLCELTVSYRSTVEIIEAARVVARRYPTQATERMRAVLRHGESPTLDTLPTERDVARACGERARALIAEGFRTVALVARTLKDARRLYKKLDPALNARLIDGVEDAPGEGVLVFPASTVKGLEFDALIVADAHAWPDTMPDARLLYVLMTRPLHRLALYAAGAPSPLLDGFDERGAASRDA